jgi:hypothetical protein
MRPHRKASACSRLFGGIASALGLELRLIGLRDTDEIERGIMEFVREGDGGLIVTASGPAIVHRALIVALAARTQKFSVIERSCAASLIEARPFAMLIFCNTPDESQLGPIVGNVTL